MWMTTYQLLQKLHKIKILISLVGLPFQVIHWNIFHVVCKEMGRKWTLNNSILGEFFRFVYHTIQTHLTKPIIKQYTTKSQATDTILN